MSTQDVPRFLKATVPLFRDFPAEGLLMGTRCGNVDPAVLIHLMRT